MATDARTRQRWQSIAEQLGLPFEPSAPPSQEPPPAEAKTEAPAAEQPPAARAEVPAVAATTAEEVAPGPVNESHAGRGRRRRSNGPAVEEQAQPDAVPTETVAEEALADEPELAPAALETTAAPPGEIVEADAPRADAAEAAPTGEGRPRGRRRRRGGRGSAPVEGSEAGDAEAAGQETAEPPAAEATGVEVPAGEGEPAGAESEERKHRRGRGRGRKSRRDRDEAPTATEDVEETTAEEGPAEEEEDDGGEVDDLSDWTAPSWNDLIDSLYRPDR